MLKIATQVSVLIALIFSGAEGYQLYSKSRSLTRYPLTNLNAAKVIENDGPLYNMIAVIGAIDREKETANTHIFELLHEKNLAKTIACFSQGLDKNDNFSRKRLTNPDTVYSGLLDKMKFYIFASKPSILEVDPHPNVAEAFGYTRPDAVIALNVDPGEILTYCHMCWYYNISRLVLTTDYSGIEEDPEFALLNQEFIEKEGFYQTGYDNRTAVYGNNTFTNYTIFKVGRTVDGPEGESAYRIVHNEKYIRVPTPSKGYGNALLSSGDLDRVIVESITSPNAQKKVFSIGPGTQLDHEVQTYMKSQGWSGRYQVNMLLGPMMNRIRKKIRAVSPNMDENKDDDDDFDRAVRKYIVEREEKFKEEYKAKLEAARKAEQEKEEANAAAKEEQGEDAATKADEAEALAEEAAAERSVDSERKVEA